jgi:hypothetical protein
MEVLGLWMAVTGLLLPVTALDRWGWIGRALATATPLVPLLEVRYLRPTVSALVRRPAHNLVAAFPAPRAECEAILSANLDSETELLDHMDRRLLLRMGLPAAGLTLTCGLLIGPEPHLPPAAPATAIHWLAVAASLPVAAYGLAMGVNLIGGRFSHRPSTGAVDSGAAVAVLLAVARRLQRGSLHLALERAAEAVTRERPLRAPTVSSDAFAFLRRGIPATTVGGFDRELGGRGLHSALDHPDRVDLARLAETVDLLTRFLTDLDTQALPSIAQACKGGP